MLHDGGDDAMQAVSVMWNCMAYFNSCVNPIIYNRTSKEFRDAFLEACGCLRDRDLSSSRELVAADGRRVSVVSRVTPDGRRRASCAATYLPSPEHLPQNAAVTALQDAERPMSNTLTIHPLSQPV